MRILLTGGAGFIASQVQDAYLKAGHEVAVLDNLVTGKQGNLNPKCRFFELDIRDPMVAGVFRDFQPEVLNHHAAQMDVRKSVADPIYDCEVNGIGTLNLLENARQHGVKKVIFSSSGGAAYGEQWFFPADETHPTEPTSPYGITKLLGDKYLQFYRDTYGIETISLRYANVYGPRQNPHGEAGVVAIFITKLLGGEEPIIFGDGLQTRDYVFVEDVVRANVMALESGRTGIFNIGTEVETSVVQIYEQLASLLGIKKLPRHGDAKAGEQRRSIISSKKIFEAWGWKAEYDLTAGLKKTVEYFKK